jgi:tRNA-binding protein
MITYQQFSDVKIIVGTIVKAETFPKAKNPAYKVWVDFGPEIGTLQTSAQITVHYTPEILIGRQILSCVNLGEKNIAGFMSQFLLLGFSDANGAIILAQPEKNVPNGVKLH